MTFTIPFNPERYRKHARINFNEVWKKSLWFYAVLALVSVVLLICVIFFPQENDPYNLELLTILVFAVTYIYFAIYFKARKSYNAIINTTVNDPLAWASSTIIEVTQDSVYYKTYNAEMTLRWNFFKRYRHIKGVLFIETRLNFVLMISEEDISNQDFNALKEMVAKKLVSF
jgi:cation transport ATPase